MKKSRFIVVAVIALTGLVFGPNLQAEPRTKSRSRDSRILVQDEPERYVLVTGSYIPQKVSRKSIGTDSMHNVRIYTQRELLITGRLPSVAGGLSLDPSITISGR